MAERIKWVDMYKGFAIILVMIGHTNSPIGGYIYLFHVAAFFFISGYTANLSKTSLGRYTLNKLTSWLVPFFTANVVLLSVRALLHTFHIEKTFYAEPFSAALYWDALLKLFTTWKPLVDLAGITWFLTVLFFAAVLAKVLHDVFAKTPKGDWWFMGAATVVLGCGFWISQQQMSWWANLDLSFHALFYFVAGYLFRKHETFQARINHYYAVPLALFFIFFYRHVYWAGVVWPLRAFGNPLNTLVASFSGIYLTYLLSVGAAKLPAISTAFIYVGTRTMVIMLYHFLAFRICYGLFFLMKIVPSQQLQNLVPPPNNHYWHVLTVLSLLMVLGLDYFISRNRGVAGFCYGFNGNPLGDKILQWTGRRQHV